jgi:hypothetical protein
LVLVPISVHMPARITTLFIGSSRREIERPKRADHSCAIGMNIATTGVLLITVDSSPLAPINLAWADSRLFGRPNTSCENQAIAPVSRRPATTT